MRLIEIRATDSEYAQVKLAAKLCHLTPSQYIKRAINASMRKEGVDAVLFLEKGE